MTDTGRFTLNRPKLRSTARAPTRTATSAACATLSGSPPKSWTAAFCRDLRGSSLSFGSTASWKLCYNNRRRLTAFVPESFQEPGSPFPVTSTISMTSWLPGIRQLTTGAAGKSKREKDQPSAIIFTPSSGSVSPARAKRWKLRSAISSPNMMPRGRQPFAGSTEEALRWTAGDSGPLILG